jgi:hypothetical protein
MYFDEFCTFTKDVSCDLYMSIIDQFYQFVPCARQFLVMRANFLAYLKKQKILYPKPNLLTLMPPVTSKLQDRITEYIDMDGFKKTLIAK